MDSSWFPAPWLHRVLLVPATILAVTLLLFFPQARAQAAFYLCRTDPIVTLSNGDVVSIYVEMNADPVDIQRIDYTLHVPKGVTALSIVYLGTEIGLVENLTVKPDAKSDEYKSETKVVAAKSVAVTATTWFETESKSATGKGGETLKVTIDTDD